MNDIAIVQEVWRQQSPRRQIPLWALRAVLIGLPLVRERYTLIRFFPHSIPASCAVRLSSCLREPVRFCHTLVQHCSAAAADQVPKPAAQESVFLVGHKRLAVLPAQAQIVAPAVLAPLDWHLISRHVLHPSSATQHTTETGNSQGRGPEFRENYHLGGLARQSPSDSIFRLARSSWSSSKE